MLPFCLLFMKGKPLINKRKTIRIRVHGKYALPGRSGEAL